MNSQVTITDFNEDKLIAELMPGSLRGRDGDWEHSKRVAAWVKQLGNGREDLPILTTAGYIHDIGWRDVLPPQKLTLDKLIEYQPIANANTETFITEALGKLQYSKADIETVIRIVTAVDKRVGIKDDEKLVLDADTLSKLCVGHLVQKFQPDEWLRMVELWKVQLPTSIQTEQGRKLYPDLLNKLEINIKEELKKSSK